MSSLQAYVWVIFIHVDDNNSQFRLKLAIVWLVIFLVILTYYYYAGEREDRRIFGGNDEMKKCHTCFENLLRDIIPISITMIKEGQIKCINKKTQ